MFTWQMGSVDDVEFTVLGVIEYVGEVLLALFGPDGDMAIVFMVSIQYEHDHCDVYEDSRATCE